MAASQLAPLQPPISLLTSLPVVIDNGSGLIKAGFAGADEPSTCFPCCVGRVKHYRVMAGAIDCDCFVGRKTQELRGLLRLSSPMESGMVVNWDDMERIWEHVYHDELKIRPDEHPVLLTEAPLNPRRNRDNMAQVFFETFNVPALYISMQAVLSLYATGKITGVVLDVGDGVSHSVPIYEGFACPSAVRRVDVAGRAVTRHLQLLLRRAGHLFSSSAEMDIVRAMKERICYVAANPLDEAKRLAVHAIPPAEFELPDHRVVRLGPERFAAPELLFQPDIGGIEGPGVHNLLADSVHASDIDTRANLLSTVVLSGGTTLLKGFGERMLLELKACMQQRGMRDLKLKIHSPPERRYAAWVGGSILAGLTTFRKIWITAEEYREDPDIIHRRLYSP